MRVLVATSPLNKKQRDVVAKHVPKGMLTTADIDRPCVFSILVAMTPDDLLNNCDTGRIIDNIMSSDDMAAIVLMPAELLARLAKVDVHAAVVVTPLIQAALKLHEMYKDHAKFCLLAIEDTDLLEIVTGLYYYGMFSPGTAISYQSMSGMTRGMIRRKADIMATLRYFSKQLGSNMRHKRVAVHNLPQRAADIVQLELTDADIIDADPDNPCTLTVLGVSSVRDLESGPTADLVSRATADADMQVLLVLDATLPQALKQQAAHAMENPARKALNRLRDMQTVGYRALYVLADELDGTDKFEEWLHTCYTAYYWLDSPMTARHAQQPLRIMLDKEAGLASFFTRFTIPV